MNSLLPRLTRLLPLVLLLLLAGCSAGYQEINGQWHYVTIDSGRGRVENPIPGADTASFEPLRNSNFARDRNRVYYEGRPVEGADSGTFRRLKGSYWADKDRVYYFDDLVPGADPATFRFVGKLHWSRDNNNVYVGADPVNPKDLATFRILDANWARDSQWYYPAYYDRHTPIEVLDYATFRILKGGWAKDCCRVFYFDRVVEGADPATFEVVNNVRGRDKNYYYLMGSRQRTVAEEEALQRNQGK